MRKGEIAHYEQFLFFPTVFSKDMYYRQLKTRACLGKGVKSLEIFRKGCQIFWKGCQLSTNLKKTLWEKEKLLVMSKLFQFGRI